MRDPFRDFLISLLVAEYKRHSEPRTSEQMVKHQGDVAGYRLVMHNGKPVVVPPVGVKAWYPVPPSLSARYGWA